MSSGSGKSRPLRPEATAVTGRKSRRPPLSEAELVRRAQDLAGRTLGELGKSCGRHVPETAKRAKGLAGQLMEQALGADAGNADAPDFSAIGIELKTLPVGRNGKPRESTFVSSISLGDVAEHDFEQSRVYRKLQRVLWMPIEADPSLPLPQRRIGHPILWTPCAAHKQALRDDWEDLVGMIASGQKEQITAHLGRYLQIRPKAAHSRVRTTGEDAHGLTRTLPLGFYLRPIFTAQLIKSSAATPTVEAP